MTHPGQGFSARLEAGRGGGAFVILPEHVVAALGGKSRVRVTGTLNGVDFASSTMGMGEGKVCLGVHKATREAAGVAIGDEITLRVGRDDRPRELTVPEDLVAALAGDDAAAAAFDRLSFTHRREYVEWITGAKRAETRTRRVTQTLERLRAR
ncbi:YdeI/OmpD-associated family protein [Krasilnikovia sp. MM14-A1259]|uniref:YdeI/OmpD-associated family protein n=1 Tax=Krasilnikovia sp. MM14-A1259 TaxID=3373539 RepID=UPI00380FE7D8